MVLSAFLLGLLGSFHCVGMCGPIAFMLPLDRKSKAKKLLQLSLYHLGRIFTYSFIGLLFGLLGKGIYLFGMQQKISIAMGVLMILIILIPQRQFNKFNFSKPIYKLIGKVKNALGKELKKKSPDTFFSIGFLNGFLPCGLLYMAIFGSLAFEGIGTSALYMVLFGLGTVPLMTAVVFAGNFFGPSFRKKIQKAIPVFVVLIGCLFILRGMGLGIPYVSPKEVPVQTANSNYNCDAP
ncbi:sulfite exporter TauE/SafE family protein [Haloflavibacter putidus]|uniref:Sulfite exporter TauE/SafE family protein n=1 Tax=Haloflavibacter putidus TaxID=2576776 RepID=A0A507ZR02_9FLAO|nr:sulfite exporter TauE/SafE family protein [Haloflavibacter putidus]TQD38694.1 sulfite exporter TauE/SafE family protein [Haloflavibacter putidus]